MQERPVRSPIHWLGGKGCFRRKLMPLLPPHTAYVEPFGGGASVLLGKAPAKLETYNDVDRALFEFFSVLSSPVFFPPFWARVCALPYSRELYDECRDTWHGCRDIQERTWRWFVVARQSFSGNFGCSWGSCCSIGPTEMAATTSGWQSALQILPAVHQRLQRVQLECTDFRDCLTRYSGPGYLAYCDPPYVMSTRKSGRYNHEMTDDHHRALVEILLKYDGAVVLSGYRTALYQPLEDAGWPRLDIPSCCQVAGRTKATRHLTSEMKRTECVWRNPEAMRRLAG